MCFLGIPVLLSRNSPLSFLGVYTVLSSTPSAFQVYFLITFQNYFPPAFQEFSLCCPVISPHVFQELPMCVLETPSFTSRNFPVLSRNSPCPLPRNFTSCVLGIFFMLSEKSPLQAGILQGLCRFSLCPWQEFTLYNLENFPCVFQECPSAFQEFSVLSRYFLL